MRIIGFIRRVKPLIFNEMPRVWAFYYYAFAVLFGILAYYEHNINNALDAGIYLVAMLIFAFIGNYISNNP